MNPSPDNVQQHSKGLLKREPKPTRSTTACATPSTSDRQQSRKSAWYRQIHHPKGSHGPRPWIMPTTIKNRRQTQTHRHTDTYSEEESECKSECEWERMKQVKRRKGDPGPALPTLVVGRGASADSVVAGACFAVLGATRRAVELPPSWCHHVAMIRKGLVSPPGTGL